MTKNFSLENNFLELEFSEKRLQKRFFKIMDAFTTGKNFTASGYYKHSFW